MTSREEERLGLEYAARIRGLTVAVDLPRRSVLPGQPFLSIERWGQADRPPLILLHGGGQTARSWDLVALQLRDAFHVLAPHLRGHGDSGWAPQADYSRRAFAGDLGRLVDEVGLEDPVVVGLSLGGLTALTWIAENPGRARALVLVDIGPEVERRGTQGIRSFMSQEPAAAFEEFVERAVAFNPLRDREQLRHSLRHNLRQLDDGRWTWKYDPAFTASRRPSGDREALWEAVQKIDCPTLLVRGDRSPVLSEAGAQRLAAAIPRSRLVTIPDAGHAVPGDQPVAFAAVLRAFLDDLPCQVADRPG